MSSTLAAGMEPAEFAFFLECVLHERGAAPLEDLVIFGSTVMKLHGLKQDIGDVDLFVTPRLYAGMRRRRDEWHEQRPRDDDPPFLECRIDDLRLHAFHAWASRDRWMDVPAAFDQASPVHALRCIPLAMVAEHKRVALERLGELGITVAGSRWEKHQRDLAVLAVAVA